MSNLHNFILSAVTIKVRKLYPYCKTRQFMHTCLIISMHGISIFLVIIECADKYILLAKYPSDGRDAHSQFANESLT